MAVASTIFVAYPHNGTEVGAPSTYVVGAAPPGSSITVNGERAKINAQGFFAHVVPVGLGNTPITIARDGGAEKMTITVHRAAPPPPVPDEPLQISPSSVQPQSDVGVAAGDIVEFGMRGSPGGQATVRIGSTLIPLQSPGAKLNAPNTGRDTAFGVTYQRTASSNRDLYTGFYRVTAQDQWQNETPIFALARNGSTVHQQGSGRISVLAQPFISSTAHDDTIVRLGPGAGRTTPLPAGVRVLVDGFLGDSYRCRMSQGKHLWIEKADLTGMEGPGTPPSSRVRTINIENEGRSGARIVIPLNQRLPFEIKQEITGGNRLQLKLYGAVSDTDWITEPSTSSHATDEATVQRRAFPRAADRGVNPVEFVTWQQLSDDVYQATINLNTRQQWGFWTDYQNGSDLVLHIKGAPPVNPKSGNLQGLKVCLDPGHGGSEVGAIGCSGIKEATINLAVAKKAQEILTQRGASVVMTRQADVVMSLDDRVKFAAANNVDLLLSVHQNSLPDGRNPWVEHGTSTYYYQPQALAFANQVRAGTVARLGFPDFHTRWQNLALCRPSRQPSALVEVGFVINPDEYADLISPGGQERAARGIADGVQNFVYQSLAPRAMPASSDRGNTTRRRSPSKTARPATK